LWTSIQGIVEQTSDNFDELVDGIQAEEKALRATVAAYHRRDLELEAENKKLDAAEDALDNILE